MLWSYGGSNGKGSACNAGDLGSIPGSRRSPGEGNGMPVFLPEESHGQREESGGLQSTGSQGDIESNVCFNL